MNDKAFEKKVDRDVAQVKKDFSTLVGDGAAGLQRKYDQVADGAREKVSGAREKVSGAVSTMKKDVGSSLSQYNEKVQDVADRFPGDFGKNAAGYPWVTITVSLVLGLLLGLLLKPGRQHSA